jgi:hypothetical protein
MTWFIPRGRAGPRSSRSPGGTFAMVGILGIFAALRLCPPRASRPKWPFRLPCRSEFRLPQSGRTVFTILAQFGQNLARFFCPIAISNKEDHPCALGSHRGHAIRREHRLQQKHWVERAELIARPISTQVIRPSRVAIGGAELFTTPPGVWPKWRTIRRTCRGLAHV